MSSSISFGSEFKSKDKMRKFNIQKVLVNPFSLLSDILVSCVP
ncbi:hypothetical protein LEP1GSC096_0003 [Leptospira interrogans serovar Hebdomadis str. R499]|nr:hypothetical protein LEP1GSC096_0003 [Leptospira interrogans serovar Hebdomadis str. R499]